MSARLFTFFIASTACASMWPISSANAQVQPGTPPPGTTTMGPDDKPEGVAEQAPSVPGVLPTTPVLPPPSGKRKEFQLLEFDGFFRFRGDWFKQFGLGFSDLGPGGASFPAPSGCTPTDGVEKPCETAVKAANMRLRLEPVIHIDEKTSVHIQADLLDNVVLGSTPEGLGASGDRRGDIGLGAFTDNQDAPLAGHNSLRDSIAVKRAWAEVETAFGLIKFGRMPSHFGLGVFHNAGGFDPIHGTYDLDSDYGDTVDRVSFSAGIPGTPFRASIGLDWAATAPTSDQTLLGADRNDGQAWDLDDNDDVNQWTFIFSRLDAPEVFRDKVLSNELALNYGLQVTYRTQSFDQTGFTVGGGAPDPTLFVPRDYKAYMPDAWARLAYGDFEVEVEAVAVLGSIEHLEDQGVSGQVDLRQLGGVARGVYHLLDRAMRIGGEVGFASGDQWDNVDQGDTHIRNLRPLGQRPGDSTVNQFIFDQDYEIDLILFRELIGAVTNAIYIRPSLEYDITDKFRVRGQNVTSFAHKKVATPGNSSLYGIEFDADVEYHNDGFSAGIAYGVLFPLGALDHPTDDADAGGSGFGYGANSGEAATAQTIQLRMMLKF